MWVSDKGTAPREHHLPGARPQEAPVTEQSLAHPARPSTTEIEKTRPCSGCGERFPRRELVEVHRDHEHFGYEVLEGERYCRPCARRHGVL